MLKWIAPFDLILIQNIKNKISKYKIKVILILKKIYLYKLKNSTKIWGHNTAMWKTGQPAITFWPPGMFAPGYTNYINRVLIFTKTYHHVLFLFLFLTFQWSLFLFRFTLWNRIIYKNSDDATNTFFFPFLGKPFNKHASIWKHPFQFLHVAFYWTLQFYNFFSILTIKYSV